VLSVCASIDCNACLPPPLRPEPIAIEALAPVDTRDVLNVMHECPVGALVRERVDPLVVGVRTLRRSHDALPLFQSWIPG
jgi:hypothetical protein